MAGVQHKVAEPCNLQPSRIVPSHTGVCAFARSPSAGDMGAALVLGRTIDLTFAVLEPEVCGVFAATARPPTSAAIPLGLADVKQLT